MTQSEQVRFSIVVPTHNRREVLVRTLGALSALERPWPCELIVVDDGSSDGSAEAARAVSFGYPIEVLEQENRGAAVARNRGAREACGEVLLFLDDDMIADPRLLIEHDAVLREGADAVMGHIPLHTGSPPSLLTVGVDRWAGRRHARLTRSSGDLTLADLLTGQLSVRTTAFAAVGGFDEAFNVGGDFGGEDTDFLYRLQRSRVKIRYAPGAVAHQYYVVSPDAHLRQWHQAGRADWLLVQKHPELAEQVATQHRRRRRSGQSLARAARGPLARPAWALAGRVRVRAGAGHTDLVTRWAFAQLRDAAYWAGVQDAGRHRSGGAATVLAYHAVEDVTDPVLRPYSVTPEQFERQLDALEEAGHRWIGLPDLLGLLEGRSVPDQAVLLTFDDGYASLLESVAPILHRRDIPATVFVVSGHLGGRNDWDVRGGAGELPLLTGSQLRTLAARGWSVAAHSRTHAHLPRLPRAELQAELSGCLEDLRSLGLRVEAVLAYPYGEHDARVRAAARRAGYVGAVGLRETRQRPASGRRFAVPRVEVTRDTTPAQLVEQVRRPPTQWGKRLDHELSGMVRRLLFLSHGRR